MYSKQSCSCSYSLACQWALLCAKKFLSSSLRTPTFLNVQIVDFVSLYSKSYLSSLERRDKANSLLPVLKDLEKEQRILQSKAGDTDIDREHVQKCQNCWPDIRCSNSLVELQTLFPVSSLRVPKEVYRHCEAIMG